MTELQEIAVCNFCYKTRDEVSLLIVGDEAGICSDCVLLCVEVVFKGVLNIQINEPFKEKTDEAS